MQAVELQQIIGLCHNVTDQAGIGSCGLILSMKKSSTENREYETGKGGVRFYTLATLTFF